MLDTVFAESIVHARPPRWAARRGLSAHTVLGRRLRPFTFWHALLLEVIGSPYARGGRPGAFDLAALFHAARVCQLRYPHTLAPLRFATLSACLLQRRYGRRLEREQAAFLHYLRDYNSPPIYGTREGDEHSISCPWYAVVVEQLLLLDPRLTLAQAWDSPIGSTRWRIAARQDAEGRKPLIETPEIRAAYAEAGA